MPYVVTCQSKASFEHALVSLEIGFSSQEEPEAPEGSLAHLRKPLSEQSCRPDTSCSRAATRICPVARTQGNDFSIPPETKHTEPKDDADAFLFVYRVKAVAAAAKALSREEAAILNYSH